MGLRVFALAEISYLTYHLDWTVFLFAHTISEVLDLLAFILVFVVATRTATAASEQRRGPPDEAAPAIAAVADRRPRRLACGAEAASPSPPTQVDLPRSYRFEPEAITVPDGTTVTWTNNDHFTHSVRLVDDGGSGAHAGPARA